MPLLQYWVPTSKALEKFFEEQTEFYKANFCNKLHHLFNRSRGFKLLALNPVMFYILQTWKGIFFHLDSLCGIIRIIIAKLTQIRNSPT